MTKLFDRRFQLANSPFGGQPSLMIVDYNWWTDNERHILNWMVDNLPNGIEHQQGMTISFDTDYDRINFLMRWGP